jgi:NAD(P)-dependent dehydrogenase (short-subunit alcohol dehydrogenase family)
MREDLFELNGERTLITGATGGFGKILTQTFLENNQKVTALGRDVSNLNDLTAIGANSVGLDLNNTEAVKNFCKSCDIFDNVIISHGILGARPMRMLSPEYTLNVIQTNLLSVLDLLANLLRAKKINFPGRIVFISSISAHLGANTAVPYAASKAGAEAAIVALARDLLHKGVTVNSVAPAAIETPMFKGSKSPLLEEKNYPLGNGDVKDVANAALFLCLKGSKYITGETIILDGGCIWLVSK